MNRRVAKLFGELGQIVGVCPCCGEIFYLSEARPYLKGRRRESFVDQMRDEERRIDRAEERLKEIELELRQEAARAGLKTAKKMLRKIDPIFSGAGYDPQDVKVIFDPVSYVIFRGLSVGKLKEINLLAREPCNSYSEGIHRSIDKAVRDGNYDFKVLRVDNAGQVTAI